MPQPWAEAEVCLAYFVSAHGFGHAARACAVMAAIRDQAAGAGRQLADATGRQLADAVHFHIFSEVPAWFFEESLGDGYTLHSTPVDVGLVQTTSLHEDLPASLAKLDAFYPLDHHLVMAWAGWLAQLQCRLVLCDIAPLGLAAARAAGIESVLIENFTWDWIYDGYAAADPAFGVHAAYLRTVFDLASHRLQTEPVCQPDQRAARRLPPISRQPRRPAAETRQRLGLPEAARVVLVTLGGGTAAPTLPAHWPNGNIFCILPAAGESLERHGQALRLPHYSEFFHPDLVAASDAVVAKAGYSTVAEVYRAGAPLALIARPRFRESAVVAAFVRQHIPGFEIAAAEFESGQWVDCLPSLLALPHVERGAADGAAQAAAFILDLLD